MTTWAFKELHSGPRWEIVKADFPRFSAAEAFAIDYFRADASMQVICRDIDRMSLVADFMVAQHGFMRQFAIEPA